MTEDKTPNAWHVKFTQKLVGWLRHQYPDGRVYLTGFGRFRVASPNGRTYQVAIWDVTNGDTDNLDEARRLLLEDEQRQRRDRCAFEGHGDTYEMTAIGVVCADCGGPIDHAEVARIRGQGHLMRVEGNTVILEAPGPPDPAVPLATPADLARAATWARWMATRPMLAEQQLKITELNTEEGPTC